VNPQMMFQRVCAVGGIVCPVLFFLALVVGGLLPPLMPGSSAVDIASHYQQHANGIRLGAGLMLISSMFYASYTALISAQMQRIPNVHQTVINTQLAAGAFACLTFLVPAMLFAVTAFRPNRAVDSTLLLNDMTWIFLVMPWPPFMVQNFAFAFAILTDTRVAPLFPRWLGYLNIWAPITFTPGVILPFFKAGPFAWNGIFVFWLPAIVFGIQFVANVVWLFKAINSESCNTASAPVESGALR
jgi:hypothetical protein